MVSYTSRLNLIKPALSENADVTQINANMDAIDEAINGGVVTSTTRPNQPYTGMLIFETDTDRVKVWDGSDWQGVVTITGRFADPYSSGKVNNFLSSAAGWQVQGSGVSFASRRGEWAFMNVIVERTGAGIDLPANGSGDISNETIATLDSEWVPTNAQPLSPAHNGPATVITVGSGGALVLSNISGSGTFATGDQLGGRGWYNLAL